MSARERHDARGRPPSADELIQALTDRGVVLVADGARLRVRAPAGALSSGLRAALAAQRDRVRALVAERFRSPAECVAARGNGQPPRSCRRMSPCARPVDGRPCLVPATCCGCGGPLPPGRRYLCPGCADKRARSLHQPTSEGVPIP